MKQREIRFRAWDGGQIDYNPNCYNDDLNDQFVIDPPYVLYQFTGLQDKKGQRIYEGDIVLLPGGAKVEVKWNEKNTGFYPFCGDEYGREGKEVEVAGSIHDCCCADWDSDKENCKLHYPSLK